MSDDTGSDAATPHAHDEVHAVGGQVGLTYVAWGAALNFRGRYEFAASDRFQGQSFSINLAKKF